MATNKSSSTRKNTSSSTKSGGRTYNKNTNNRTRSSGNAARRNTSRTYNKKRNSKANEIKLFIYLAVSIFIICSNFGWCGIVGNKIAEVMFGLFGVVAYAIPFYLFLTAALFLANGTKKRTVKRVLCIGLLIIAVAFCFQINTGFKEMDFKTLYALGSEKKVGGGALFGSIIVTLHKGIGLTGCIIVTALIGLIGFITVLDVSIIQSFKNKIEAFAELDEDDDYEEEYVEETKKPKNKFSMKSITLGDEADDISEKQDNKKKKNRIVKDEEIHELRPEAQFDLPVPKIESKDFFSKNKFSESADKIVLRDAKMDDSFDSAFGISVEEYNGDEPKPFKFNPDDFKDSAFSNASINNTVKDEDFRKDGFEDSSNDGFEIENTSNGSIHKNRKTKESQAEVEATTEEVAHTIAENENGDIIKKYIMPPTNLLRKNPNKNNNNSANQVKATADKLVKTLETFGVKATVINCSCGPAVTRYELQPEMGVKVSKIVGLTDDIKLNLAAEDIRIEAPIPGKAAIGIEVPNKESQMVYFRDLIESNEYQSFRPNLSFAVGKDISGETIVADIAKMPHLLIAGSTGSGKSVCINTLILSILYKAKPDDVKLIMVDPKQVELSVYNGLPHMLIPVVTDPKKAAGALNWAVIEMTNRYQLFKTYNVRNLQGYNDKVKEVTGKEDGNEELKKLPQIVIIVDELADLMMVAHGEVEDAIVRLSQLARAAGIHLVIATQRPSVDVITGLIKANVPSRIAMSVSSGVDSRTIIDMVGAEKLLGNGDMLFYPTGYTKPVRIQGAYVSDDEITKVVDFIKKQTGEIEYDEKISTEIENVTIGNGMPSSTGGSEYDDYFVDAGKFIISKDKGSIGMLQRMYKIGFNRAARIMDQLADAGVVGPEEGTKARRVLMTLEEFENFVENNM